MATADEYAAVRAALLKLIVHEEQTEVPAMFRGMVPADVAPKAADALSKLAVDTLDAYRASHGAK
jgi:hypothetical protein